MSVSLEVQRILEDTLGILPDTTLFVEAVLVALQDFFTGQHIRHRAPLCVVWCRGKTSDNFIASLQDVVTCCRSYAATRTTASAIHASPSEICAVSSQTKQTRWEKTNRPSTSGWTASCQDFLHIGMRSTPHSFHTGNYATDEELVLYNQCIVVPRAPRRSTLAHLHDSHCGARSSGQVVKQISRALPKPCKPYQTLQQSQQHEPFHSDDVSSRPFESVSADFFIVGGKAFLVIADNLSGWPTIIPCVADTYTFRTMWIFNCYFCEVGVPVRLRTDGWPQFSSSEFQSVLAT
ncbi:uncharacterized protein LOC119584601 [Penaeus monodon]|uniref:uncharacterized protein LOC119584601 n=1 Tax=Penaeus monodon TaxID=6687 RepID=UPI0018A72124|nr:uncharacterized protein LOC119584601 [Penaeus monodon]